MVKNDLNQTLHARYTCIFTSCEGCEGDAYSTIHTVEEMEPSHVTTSRDLRLRKPMYFVDLTESNSEGEYQKEWRPTSQPTKIREGLCPNKRGGPT